MQMQKILSAILLLAVVFFGSSLSHAQEVGKHGADYTYAPDSPKYWRNMHSTRPGSFVFQRDPNVWVYTREVAERAGLPLEWASDELKGVAAAAFRMEPNSLGPNCGWGGNPKACKPEMQCVLELYFDRQAQPLPWAPNRPIADFYWQEISSAYHFLPANGWAPASNGDVPRGSKRSPNPDLGHSPFSDPKTGEELSWETRVLAYDREIHSRYAFVRVDLGCQGLMGSEPHRDRMEHLESKESHERRLKNPSDPLIKTFHEYVLPSSWDVRVGELRQQYLQRDSEFYKGIWNQMNEREGAPK